MYVKEHDRTVRIDVLLKVNPTREGDPHSHRASLCCVARTAAMPALILEKENSFRSYAILSLSNRN